MEPIDDLETPVKEETEEPKTPRKRLYKWATEGEDNIMYEFLFKFMTGKTFEALFAPILYSHHWWLYVLDVKKRKFYVLDSLNPKTTGSSERMKLNRFADELADFREQIVKYILLHHDNFYRTKAVEASEPRQRTSRPSHALQSPYMELNSSDLESGNAKHKKK
ncbi:hypothetical protein PIB30_055786 [Stylosanthes scabra]|uniref:Ubiquitin-like protease family profile domain-containing protein n=1 Tax=Stylosanthes scabra TaxID=79078 RepID=A0ABU6ZHX2_9FABA|nr:hypothetical protein [Stylosanthes scabra]